MQENIDTRENEVEVGSLEEIRNDLADKYGQHFEISDLEKVVEILKQEKPFGGTGKLYWEIIKWISSTLFYLANFFYIIYVTDGPLYIPIAITIGLIFTKFLAHTSGMFKVTEEEASCNSVISCLGFFLTAARFDCLTISTNFKHIKYRYRYLNAKHIYERAKYALLLAHQYKIVIKYNLIQCFVEDVPFALYFISMEFAKKEFRKYFKLEYNVKIKI
jgi:hypothetical protein